MAVSLKYNVFCHTAKTVQEWLKEHDKEFKMLTPDPNANSISNNATHKKQRIHCQHPLAKHHSTHTQRCYIYALMGFGDKKSYQHNMRQVVFTLQWICVSQSRCCSRQTVRFCPLCHYVIQFLLLLCTKRVKSN